jgi:deoxycytidine triphosphate deaminase
VRDSPAGDSGGGPLRHLAGTTNATVGPTMSRAPAIIQGDDGRLRLGAVWMIVHLISPEIPNGLMGSTNVLFHGKPINMASLASKRASEASKLSALLPSETDPHADTRGVLLSDEIEFYALNHSLIAPFDRANLKPAAYELTIGDEYFLSGEFLALSDESDPKSRVVIPPFQVAVLKTTEVLCLPRYIIARWNIRVRHAYSGLLWVGGPQVDPGYVGHLFCPIYNLSDKEVTLRKGDRIAVIDFVKTTPFDRDKSADQLVRYRHPPKRVVMEDYGIDELRSALFTKASEKLVEFEGEIREQRTRFFTFTQISFAIFALVLSLVAITSKVNAENLVFGEAFFGAITIAISFAALLIALFSYVGQRVGRLVYELYGRLMAEKARDAMRFLRRAWWTGIGVSGVIAVLGGLASYSVVEPLFRDLRQERVLTKADVENWHSITANLDRLTGRVSQLEQGRAATLDDLERLKTTLERQIQAAKPGTK